MTDGDENAVVVRKLTKVFRDFWLREKVTAVADLDLDIRRREVFGLLGPNGSGKSTTLKMILGLLFPTRGHIAVLGRPPTDVAVKARIGFLPEESYLYPSLDARETLDFYGRLFHQPRGERMRRVDMLLDMVGLAGAAYRRVGEYSKGMQRRIGLAQALINDPDLLILDEPTSGMDPLGARQFKDLIRTLAARGKTVLVSSHLLADVEDICDRVCILYGGRQRAMGAVGDLLARHAFTQITTGELDEAAVGRVRAALAAGGREIIEISHPRDKLESLFLRIVQEAQDQRLATGGALSGGHLAEFLRADVAAEGRKVLDGLLVPSQGQQPAPQTPPPPQPAAAPSQEIIQELTAGPQAQPSPEAHEPPPNGDVPKVDRKVLDDLLDKQQGGAER